MKKFLLSAVAAVVVLAVSGTTAQAHHGHHHHGHRHHGYRHVHYYRVYKPVYQPVPHINLYSPSCSPPVYQLPSCYPPPCYYPPYVPSCH